MICIFGHKVICKYRDVFSSPEEHDTSIIDKILALPKRTVLIVLGDFLFDGDHYDSYIKRLSKKRCRIKLVMGNHDSRKLYKEDIFEIQLPLYSYKNSWVSHAPIHPDELRGRHINIHGHLHKTVLNNKRYFNVNLDCNDYEFVEWEKIRSRYEDSN